MFFVCIKARVGQRLCRENNTRNPKCIEQLSRRTMHLDVIDGKLNSLYIIRHIVWVCTCFILQRFVHYTEERT